MWWLDKFNKKFEKEIFKSERGICSKQKRYWRGFLWNILIDYLFIISEPLENLWISIFYTTVMLWHIPHILRNTKFWNKKWFCELSCDFQSKPKCFLTHVMSLVSFHTPWKLQKPQHSVALLKKRLWHRF